MGEQDSCLIPTMAVRELLSDAGAERLGLELRAGEQGLDNAINRSRIQKPGLALAGFIEYIYAGRVQILGKAEMSFLVERPPQERARIMAQLCRQGASCFVVTGGQAVPAELLDVAESQNVPLMTSLEPTPVTIDVITRFLQDRLAPRTVIHGVLIDLYGLGVLLLGESGVGKSECALDLIVRGHRLVSDDVVEVKRIGDLLVGTGPELTRFHMELRGVGIVSVKDLFGVAAVRFKKNVEYVIRLDPWKEGKRYDRLGLDEGTHEILGIELPYVELPVGPGRNLSVLIEVAARNHLLKLKGYHPAKQLARRLDERLHGGGRSEEDDEEAREAIREGEDRDL